MCSYIAWMLYPTKAVPLWHLHAPFLSRGAFAQSSAAARADASWRIQRLLSHASEPLRACAPVVTLEYARRAKALRMPGRQAARAAAAANGFEAGVAHCHGRRPLDTFFPFDPYLLRRSAVHLDLKRTYIRWQSSEGHDLEYDSDDRSTASGLDERPSSMIDSYREHFGVAMHMGLARPVPLGAIAMSYDEAVVMASSLSLN